MNVMVALRVWGPEWQDKRIRIHCDNVTVVVEISSCVPAHKLVVD